MQVNLILKVQIHGAIDRDEAVDTVVDTFEEIADGTLVSVSDADTNAPLAQRLVCGHMVSISSDGGEGPCACAYPEGK